MSTGLNRIAEKAKSDKKLRFTALMHHLTVEFLRETWKLMNRGGAAGIDGETAEEFEVDLDRRLEDLVTRLKAKTYKAPPVRRAEIPKDDGKMRKLGIPTVEDRLLQRAVARILEATYEPNFQDVSYGFRPGRSAHQALRDLRNRIMGWRVNWVFEADIRGFFDCVNHEWLRRMLDLRIGDPGMIRLIGKWLNAGVMENGVVVRTEEGTPQGGPISPILANIYLHYVLDLWFEVEFKRSCKGEAYLTRYADDFVVCFQHEQDATKFAALLVTRLAKFNLALAEGKTRLIRFGRFAEKDSGGKPDTFDFLGFTHVCGKDRKGRYAVIRIPRQKSCRKFLDRTKKWLAVHLHTGVQYQQKQLSAMLRGFYHYFSLAHSGPKLVWVRQEVLWQWFRALRRRGQRNRGWRRLAPCPWFSLPPVPGTLHRDI